MIKEKKNHEFKYIMRIHIDEEFIQQVEDWINNLLRPMFGFKSSLEMAKIVS